MQSEIVRVDVAGNSNTRYVFEELKRAFEQNKKLKRVLLFKGSRLIETNPTNILSNNSEKKYRKIWEQGK